MKNFNIAISKATGIPLEVISDTPKLELVGKNLLCIENHKGIKSFSATNIVVNTKDWTLYVAGSSLTIVEIDNEHIKIKGHFDEFKYT